MNLTKALTRSLLLAAALALPASAGTIGFEEDFALAPDRTVPLAQLIPGTEDFYYYTMLQQQNTNQLDAADKTLAAWIKQFNRTPRVLEMENRQALLKYPANAQFSLGYLTRTLNLTFNHERETLARQAALPTTLDPKLISRETLTARALAENPHTLHGFENSALDFLISSDLSDERLHELLSNRLLRPDYDQLPTLIAHDLASRFNSGFGSLAIHHNLLLAQLDALLKLKPELLNDSNFVNIYLTKLQPAAGIDIRFDLWEKSAYLNRLWSFASRLGPAHNSLKANILYQRLLLDRKSDSWDKGNFLAYLQLPRQVWYINREFMKTREHQNNPANLAADFSQSTLLPPIMEDEPLVKSYLLHFLADAPTPDEFKPLLEADYLNDVFAESKLTTGIGDQDKAAALLPAAKLQALKDRVDIDFAFTNKDLFNPDDKVGLDVNIKNVKTLLVKVYEVNAANFYKTAHREINTDINLDGLVANEEHTLAYTDPPLRRNLRHFDFPTLNSRGVYVIEFIGNGKSSRALVRKGKFRYLEKDSAAGQLFVLLDEANQPVNDARLYLAGHEYPADKDGLIAVPYSTNPQPQQPIVLQSAAAPDFASLDFTPLKSETYTFLAPMHIARESLLRYGKAALLLRPTLFVQSTPISTKLLEEVTLTLTSTDRDGISVSKEIPNFKLFDDRETTYDFAVPDRLKSLTFTLQAKIQNVSLNKKEDLSATRTFILNEIDQSALIEDLHLSRIDGNFIIDVLGKTGETLPDQPVNLTLKHKNFTQPVQVTLKSDAAGRIALGALDGIETLSAQDPEGLTRTWYPAAETKDTRTDATAIHALAGETIRIPYMGAAATGDRSAFSLLELADNSAFVADRFSALSVKDAFLEIKGLPPGDYNLLLKNEHKEFTLRIAKGDIQDGWLLSPTRQLQLKNQHPLQIISVTADAASLKIQLANATKLTRVHVFATRFIPAYLPFPDLAAPAPEVALRNIIPPESLYESGRLIGDEYRYILDRKYAPKYPGNTLARPGLLLNPWAIRSTQTELQEAQKGGEFHGARDQLAKQQEELTKRLGSSGAYGVAGERIVATQSPDLDFLAEPASVLPNLQPDANGFITIPRKDLGDHQEFHILAVDPSNTVYREISIPQPAQKIRDLRLAQALDSAKHFTEQKQITILQKGQSITLPAASGNALESYDSLPKLYRLYSTLHPDPTLAEFSFILNWPQMKDAEKREKYAKYACHELNFFLAKKDPVFFAAVIRPYLQNKKDQTFMDHFLLGDDLASYLAPWSYGQLNTVERILLAQRLNAEAPKTARFIKDNFDLIPPDLERFNYLFTTAISSNALSQISGGSLQWAATQPTVIGGFGGAGSFNGRSLALPAGTGVPGSMNGQNRELQQLQQMARTRPTNKKSAQAKAGKGDEAEKDLEDASVDAAQEALRSDEADGKFDDADKITNLRLNPRRAFYRPQDKTMEYVENNYYHLPIEQQNTSLVQVNAFWNDYAQNTAPAFLSKNIAYAASNFTEIMFALAVTDLPFDEPTHTLDANPNRVILTAAGPIIAFHKEIAEAPAAADAAKTPILVSQNYFRLSDRYTYIDNERTDKYLTAADEFLTHVVYGCQVVITNPTSSRQKLDALLQIPQGALPVANAKYTDGLHLDLQPYETKAIEYNFYFPSTGQYPHYPVQVAKNEKLVASVPSATLNVVATPTKIDTTSWDYISQNGTPDQTLQFLKANNLERLNLEKIAWRMKDPTFYASVLALLRDRHVYQNTLWSYSIKNNDPANINEFLQHQDNFVNNCGLYLNSPLLTLNPVARHLYQHMEYLPLINARAHRLGRDRTILNNNFFAEYEATLTLLSYHPALTDEDLLSATYYLLLQDRIDEALKMLARVAPKNIEEQLQYDYFTAYAAFFTDNPETARPIAEKYRDYKVDRWKNQFLAMLAQLDEIAGKAPAAIVDKDNRDQQQNLLAAAEPTFDFHVDNKKIILAYKNIPEVRINYYLMDIELMFSQNPFLQEDSGGGASQFSIIKPNATAAIPLDPAKPALTLDLPEKFLSQNVMIEITAAGETKSHAYYANSLNIQLAENYGTLTVTSDKTSNALPKAYVKVYARFDDGRVRFFKDGYTDLRGKFEYASLSTDQLDHVQTFSLLILTDTEGALVKSAQPPKR